MTEKDLALSTGGIPSTWRSIHHRLPGATYTGFAADSTVPATTPLQIHANDPILTTGAGSISTIDFSDGNGRVTPLVSAQGSGQGELNNPSALAIGPDGLLYVLDAGNNRIQKFTVATGEYQGGFPLPAGMTVFTAAATFDGNGDLVYNGNGTNVLSTSMAISAEGHIYLGDGLGGGFVFSLDGNLLANFHPPEPDGTWSNGPLVSSDGGPIIGVGSYLNYDGMGNVITYVGGKDFSGIAIPATTSSTL